MGTRLSDYSVLLLVALAVLLQCTSVESYDCSKDIRCKCANGGTYCEGEHRVCKDRECVCKSGYVERNEVCIKQCDEGKMWYEGKCEGPDDVPCREGGTDCPKHAVCDKEVKKCHCKKGYKSDSFDCVEHFDPVDYCTKCINIRNGPNHYPDPWDCSSYFQCTGNTGNVKAYHKRCAPCTYWNQDMLTCVHLAQAKCPETAPPKTKFPVAYSCCCFRQCRGYASVDKCCPAKHGYGFSYAAQKCVKKHCHDKCTPHVPVHPTYKPWKPLPPPKPSCLVLYMPLNKDFRDIKHNYVDPGKVVIRHRAAYFKGYSHIEVPLFTNYYWGRHVTISFWYKADMDPTQYVTRLVSNGDCDGFGTIAVNIEKKSLWGTITNVAGKKFIVKKHLINHKKWHHVVMTYNGRSLRLFIDGILVASKKAFGHIKRYPAPLQISTAYCKPGKSDFQWYIDEVKVYRCALRPYAVTKLHHKGH